MFSVKARILQEILSLLQHTFSIYPNTIIKNHSQSLHDQTYVLSITGRQNFIFFQKHIGFIIPLKKQSYAFLLGHIKEKNEELCSHRNKKIRRTAFQGSRTEVQYSKERWLA